MIGKPGTKAILALRRVAMAKCDFAIPHKINLHQDADFAGASMRRRSSEAIGASFALHFNPR
jgi:hypothetical protein